MANTNKTRVKKSKTTFKFQWWMALVLIVLVGGVGLVVLRFSNAGTYSVADNTFVATVGSVSVFGVASNKIYVLSTTDGKQFAQFDTGSYDYERYPSGAIKWTSTIGNTGKRVCYTIAKRSGPVKTDIIEDTSYANFNKGDTIVFTRKGQGDNDGCS